MPYTMFKCFTILPLYLGTMQMFFIIFLIIVVSFIIKKVISESQVSNEDISIITNDAGEQVLLLPSSLSNVLPSVVKGALASLGAIQQQMFVEEYNRKKKSVFVAYVCLLVGLQYGYLRKWGLQVVFWITAGGVFIWWIILLFSLSSKVKNYNRDVAIEVMRNVKILSQ